MKVYYVTKRYSNEDEFANNIYAVRLTLKQAQAYVYSRIYLDNQSHFNNWCELHKKDPKLASSFDEYLNILLDSGCCPFDEFAITSFKYNKQDICDILDDCLVNDKLRITREQLKGCDVDVSTN